MPRYLPIQPDAANPEIKETYDRVKAGLGQVPNYLKTLAHSPHYLEAVADLYLTMAAESSLSNKIKTLVALKTCKMDRCSITIKSHIEAARAAGWSEEQIDEFDEYIASDLLNHYEKDVLQLVELVLTTPDDIPQLQFWAQLDNHFTSDQVVEIITLIGFHNMVNRFLLAVEVEPDAVPVEA